MSIENFIKENTNQQDKVIPQPYLENILDNILNTIKDEYSDALEVITSVIYESEIEIDDFIDFINKRPHAKFKIAKKLQEQNICTKFIIKEDII